MLFTEPMKKVEILILKSDLDAVMRYLGFSGCVQLIAEGHEQRELSAEEREIADLRLKVESVARFLGVQGGADGAARAPAPERAILRARAQALMESTRELLEEEGRLLQRKLALEKTADELSVFSHIKIPFSSLQNTSHLVFRAASVAPDSLQELETRLGKRTLIIRLNRPGHFLAVAPKKGRWALDSELRKFEAQEIKIPEGMKGVPADMLAAVNADLEGIAEGLREVEKRKTARRAESLDDIRFLLDHLELDTTIDTVKQNLPQREACRRSAGWIPRRQLRRGREGPGHPDARQARPEDIRPGGAPRGRRARRRFPSPPRTAG